MDDARAAPDGGPGNADATVADGTIHGLTIVQNQVPQPDCIIPGAETDLYRPSGLLDTRGKRGYLLFPLLRNDMPPTSVGDDQIEPNLLSLRRFEVELEVEGAVSGAIPGELINFSVPVSGEIAPGQLRAVSVEIIPDGLVSLLVVPEDYRPTVTATVRVIADHMDGEVASPRFIYPVELCDGCLVLTLDSCPAAGDDTASLQPNVCGIPQDNAVSCCNDPLRGFVCLASPGG